MNERPPLRYDLTACAGCGREATRWSDTADGEAAGCCGRAECLKLIASMRSDATPGKAPPNG